MSEQFQNLSIFEILIVFKIEKNSENLVILQIVKFCKFDDFLIREIL